MKLTPGEMKVMQLLWKNGEMKPAEIQSQFPEAIKNSALRSYLAILVEKKHVKRRLVGKAYYYSAVTPERRAFQSMLKDLVELFCGGSKEQLVMSLVENEELTSEQLKEISRIAATAKSSKPTKKKR